MSTKVTVILVIAIFLGLAAIYMYPGGHKVAYKQKDYDLLCIEGVTYIAINKGLNSAMMSIMLDKDGKVVACK